MCAAVWKLPADFDDIPTSEDQSSHRCLELVCKLDPGEHGDMKRYDKIKQKLIFVGQFFNKLM